MKREKLKVIILSIILVFSITLTGCSEISDKPNSEHSGTLSSEVNSTLTTSDVSISATEPTELTPEPTEQPTEQPKPSVSLSSIPTFNNSPYIAINENKPYFSSDDFTTVSFEEYSNLDSLGRCGVAYACVGKDIMPTEERGSIGSVKPSGWQTVKYDCVDGKYLYNRCHLIGYQLSGENANTKNLITGTRYLNVDGMLPFENMVADYVKETGNHVLYRVTPIFDGNNLLPSGVLMEAESVEDKGEGILFCVYCYNNQPGVTINYSNGDSSASGSELAADISKEIENNQSDNVEATYILNTNTKKFHKPDCSSVKTIKESNKQTFDGSRDELIAKGYAPCKICNP